MWEGSPRIGRVPALRPPAQEEKANSMTTETQTQQNITQPIIWLVVAIVVIVALSYFFVW
jgi:hypothetical protein